LVGGKKYGDVLRKTIIKKSEKRKIFIENIILEKGGGAKIGYFWDLYPPV
jgi:hypothetical protein